MIAANLLNMEEDKKSKILNILENPIKIGFSNFQWCKNKIIYSSLFTSYKSPLIGLNVISSGTKLESIE